MLNRSNAWVVPTTAALLILAVAWCTREAAVPSVSSVQAVADSVSQTHYQTYQLDMENMGLGLYGGADYDMGYRNRDGWEGPGSLGNQEARLYIQDAFEAMGLSVSVQGSYLNVVGEEDGLVGSKDYVDNHVIPGGENIVGMINMDMILRPGSDVDPHTVIDAELEAQSKHPPSVAWARAYQQAAADYVPSLAVNDTIIDCESTTDNDSFLNEGYPAFLIIENSLPDFWDANKYYHTFEDATDRLANDSSGPNGVAYDYAFATDVTRTAVALIAQEAVLVPERAPR